MRGEVDPAHVPLDLDGHGVVVRTIIGSVHVDVGDDVFLFRVERQRERCNNIGTAGVAVAAIGVHPGLVSPVGA